MENLPTRRPPASEQRTELEARAVRNVPAGYIEIDASDSAGDDFGNWLHYFYILARHKLALTLMAVAGCSIAFAVSLFQTPTYVARATLEFGQPSERQPLGGISFLENSDPLLMQTQVQLLRSGRLQARVSKKLAGTRNEADVPPLDPLGTIRRWIRIPPPTGAAWQEAIATARSGLTVTPLKDTRIVQITVESTLPRAAAEYANTLIQEFVDQTLEERWLLYQSTGAWLERAQEELKIQLEESEQQLLAYARESGLVVTSNEENVGERKLVELQSELGRAQADRIAKEAVHRTATSKAGDSLAAALDRGPMAQYELKLADLRRELADARTTLTDANPKVVRLNAQIRELEYAQARERANILTRARTEYETAMRREQQLMASFQAESRALSDQEQRLIRYKMLQREVDTYRTLYATTLQRGKEASVASALRPVAAKLLDSANIPNAPSSPNIVRNLVTGLFGGLILGISLVLLRDYTDTSIRSPGTTLLPMPVRELGVIPTAAMEPVLPLAARQPFISLTSGSAGPHSNGSGAQSVELATWDRKNSLFAESFRRTLTSILLSSQKDTDRRVILVTSPSPREGKTTVAANLAIALAEIRPRVLLIDADVRCPRVHTIFGQANTWGLTDLLREQTPCIEYPIEALARPTNVPGLFSLPSGPGAESAAALLHSTRMVDVLNRVRNEFDAILIDTPPVLSVADARIVSRFVDSVVLVVRAGQTSREAASTAITQFDADGVPVIGTILNDWNPRSMGSAYYKSDYSEHAY